MTTFSSISTRICLKMKLNVFLVTRKVFLNLPSSYVAQTNSHHPGFLGQRRQLRDRTSSSSTDCTNKHIIKQTRAINLFLITANVRIRRHSCLLLCLSCDIFTSNNSFKNLTMFIWGHWSKTLQPPAGKLKAGRIKLCRLIDEFNVN